ncbi:DUF3243 domain-containing protein [Cytobacillus sp. NCCP-133]|uniref:DUF3243 domain-containing protein n=1 Tax=Cytobacillus sp. NCCP-133 TaxID=766848 RepID=UPI00222E9134|nr:DUF3243 domain-containing protein [Cytobacillus sp. NCCP-133]GLB59966.1 hypothetical protein NCCP133_20980 [Cytobacillus sp. NCCP-133]
MDEQEHVIKQDGELDSSNVSKAMDRISNERAEDILSSFDEFKSYLSERFELGKKLGLNEEQLAVTAEKVAAYLAENVNPRNSEEQLLKELWKVGDEEERHKLAHMLVRLTEQA